MGTWGTGIKQNDLVLDIISVYEKIYNKGHNHNIVKRVLLNRFKESRKDKNESSLFWIALAECQWSYGVLEKKVFRKIIQIYKKELEKDIWIEQSEKLFLQRKKKLEKFIEKLSCPKEKPKKRRKIIIRKPLYKTGDCLSLSLENGKYGAALVLDENHVNPEYGRNLITNLNYYEDKKPDLIDFEKKDYLYLNYGGWKNKLLSHWFHHYGHRKVKKKIEVIGQIDIQEKDIKDNNSYTGYINLIYFVEEEFKYRKNIK